MAHQGSYDGGQQRLRVLLVGHICSPDLGSEPGFIWNWAWHLSDRHDVWVIAHPLCRAAVETAMAQHRDRALRFVWVGATEAMGPLGSGARRTGHSSALHALAARRLGAGAAAARDAMLRRRAPRRLGHCQRPAGALATGCALRLGAARRRPSGASALRSLSRKGYPQGSRAYRPPAYDAVLAPASPRRCQQRSHSCDQS
jgi:hypothetical protein